MFSKPNLLQIRNIAVLNYSARADYMLLTVDMLWHSTSYPAISFCICTTSIQE